MHQNNGSEGGYYSATLTLIACATIGTFWAVVAEYARLHWLGGFWWWPWALGVVLFMLVAVLLHGIQLRGPTD